MGSTITDVRQTWISQLVKGNLNTGRMLQTWSQICPFVEFKLNVLICKCYLLLVNYQIDRMHLLVINCYPNLYVINLVGFF